jgi:hypothetical protein
MLAVRDRTCPASKGISVRKDGSPKGVARMSEATSGAAFRYSRPIGLAACFARALHRHCLLLESEGAGKAGWPLHPGPSREKVRESAKTTGTGGDNRPSLRNGLRLIRTLPGEPAFATVAGHDALASSPTWRCMGAPGPHDFAVRGHAVRLSAHPTATAFHPTFVTTRTPLDRRGTEAKIRQIRISGKRNIFAARP